MSSADKSQTFPSDRMSTLMSGSVADRPGSDHPQSSNPRPNALYDPFTGRAQGRYSPPRAEFAETSPQEIYSARTFQPYDATTTTMGPYTGPQVFQSSEATHFSSRERPQRTVIIEDGQSARRRSEDSFGYRTSSPISQEYGDIDPEGHKRGADTVRSSTHYHARRRPSNQDEFDGPAQYLPLPLPQQDNSRTQELLALPVHLDISEQDEILRRANDVLSECAFHFTAKYQFPVPLERDKPPVRSASDRDWTEWAYLIKRLATKRRIPARILYDNQIKQLVTTLENSIPPRQTNNKDPLHTSKRSKDDRYILQLLSAGTQVAKILMDSLAMEQLDELYARTEAIILERRRRIQLTTNPV